MPRYFLHSFDASSSVFDDVGRDLTDDAAAREHAIWCARDIVAHSLLDGGEVDLSGYLSVQDLHGRECCRVCFRDLTSQPSGHLYHEGGCCGAPRIARQADGDALSWRTKAAVVAGLVLFSWVLAVASAWVLISVLKMMF